MRVFQIKGVSGLLVLMLAILGVVAVALLLPASFMWVLWNALVFEGLNGPEIAFWQGILLWGAILSLLYGLLRPQFQVQFRKAMEPTELEPPKSVPPSKKEDA